MNVETLKRKPDQQHRKSRFEAMNELSDRCLIAAKGLAEPNPSFDRVTCLAMCAYNHFADHGGTFIFTAEQLGQVPRGVIKAALIDWSVESKWKGFTRAEWQEALNRFS